MSMNNDEIAGKVNEVFEESFEVAPEDLLPEKLIFDDLGLDSLDIVDLVVALQKKFDIKIRSDDRVRSVRTLGDVHRLVQAIRAELLEDGGEC